MRVKLTILLLSILAANATSWAQDAEATLKQFEGKTLILRHALQSDSQQYDAAGKVLKGGKDGSWTVFGGIMIDRVTLTPDKLRLEGQRIFFLFPKQKLTLFEFKRRKAFKGPPFSPSVNVEVILDKPIDSAEQGLTVLGRIFALKTEDFLESLPDFWRAYLLDHHFNYDASQKKEAEYRWSEEVPKASKPIQNVPSESTKDPKHEDSHELATYPIGPGSGVKAPKPKHTPEPDYSEIAKYEGYQGTAVVNVIVGTDGNVHYVRLLRPLGMGLDENAQSTVQTWRFQPAIRNGQPVAVEMNIEIAFNLY
ncbi:MAG: energy transducer TonB [Acidobacteriia bacterium]|nr:energy transducer TonB [Terriglobia bacterium]